MSSNYLILNGDVLIDGGVPSVVVSGSAPTAGMVIAATGSATAQWSDVGAGTITLSGNVTGAANANTVVAITPAAAAGTTGSNLAITPQPGTSSGGNVGGGSAVTLIGGALTGFTRWWKADISALTLTGTLTLAYGSAAIAITTLTTNQNVIDLYSPAANTLLANL